ncbi:hypothetical protein Tco_0025219 [Tanacetum coccineum]
MRLNFEGDHLPLLVAMLPPAQATIVDAGTGEAATNVPHTTLETIQETRPEPDNSQEHLPTPPRPISSDHIPPVVEQGHTLDPNIASFSGAHESDPDLFTSTNVEDETLGGSFHTTPPRTTPVPPKGPTLGDAGDLATLTSLSSLVSELVQKVSTLESELKAHKLLFKDVVVHLVKKVKALELKLKTRSRKVVMNAHVDVSPGADIPPSPPLPIDLSAGVSSSVSTSAPTGPLTVSPSSTTVLTRSSIPAAETIPAGSGTTPESPSSSVIDARKGKSWEAAQRLQAQELADFEKQRAESLMKDANLARQMSQDFEMTEAQRKRQMVELVNTRRKELVEQRDQERRDRPMTPSQLRQYMSTYVKNQGPAVYSTGWTIA